MNNIWKTRLLETFEQAYATCFEADQSKMTPAQVKKDVEKRNKAQTIGMEIEFYADIDYDEVETYIQDDLGIERGDGEVSWNGEGDASLDACDTGGEAINYFNDRLESGEDPSDVISEYYGSEVFDDAIIHYLEWSTDFFEDLSTISDEIEAEKEKAEEAAEDEEAEEYTPKTAEEIIADYAHADALKLAIDYDAVTSDQVRRYSDLCTELHDMFAGDQSYEEYLKEHYWDHDGAFDEEVEAELEGTYGVEINFSGPRKLSEKEKILDEVDTIMNDSYINAQTHYGSGGDGETGLHIHFGLASHKLTNMDMLRLVINTQENIDEISRLAKRPAGGTWQRNVTQYTNLLNKFINPKDISTSLDIPNTKYFGTSFAHHAGKGTVEFRWGHASVAEDRQALSDYIDFLVNLINKSFTGSDSLEYNGVTIKEVSKDSDREGRTEYSGSRLIAIKDNKVIKKGHMKDYSKAVQTGKEKVKEQLEHQIKHLQRLQAQLKPYIEIRDELVKKFKDRGYDLSTQDKVLERYEEIKDIPPDDRTEEIVDEIVDIKEIYKANMAISRESKNVNDAKERIKGLEKRFLGKKKK